MPKAWTYPVGLVALAMAAVPCAAQAAPAGPITSDTVLKFGVKGVLTLDGWDPTSEKFKSRKAPVAVRVLKVEAGKASDMKNQGLPASTTGMVPFYIRSEVSYTGADWEGSPPLFSGEFSDGSDASALITSRDFGPCAYTSTITLNKKQRTGLSCRVVLAPAKVPVVAAYLFHPVGEHKSIKVTWNKTGK
jgi:hypothetical protein